MERSNPLYKVRRKAQVAAYYILPHEVLSKIYYRILIREKLNLKDPKTFNEKLQWLKLYYFPKDAKAVACADKFQVREYVAEKGAGAKLNQLLGVWEDAKDIDWDLLPDKFVLKCTHGCAYNIICKDKSAFDKKAATKQLNKWLKENFAAFNVELHYGEIKPRRIIAEAFLGEELIDFKFFCFHGQPQFMYVSSDMFHDRQCKMGFFDLEGKRLPLTRSDYGDIGDFVMPDYFDEMVETAKTLSADFPFVRVDFFKGADTYVFAELTFTPCAAMMPIDPREYDRRWGEMLDISELVEKHGK